MTTDTGDLIRVGHVKVPLATAEDWVRAYTDIEQNATGKDPYAYPAYDRFSKETNDPLQLTDGDLLAPVLLNVRLSIRSFYALQHIRETLQAGLANQDLARPLAEIDDPEQIAAMVKPLYAVMDDPATKPSGVGVTKLSKVLHRKRPQSLVLHDVWVKACYVDKERGPVFPMGQRSWADYMTAVTAAIGEDIRTQQAQFERLDKAAYQPGELSHVRLLDILAWKSQGHTPADQAGSPDPDDLR